MSHVTFLTSAVFGQVGLLPVGVRRELPKQPRDFSPVYPGPACPLICLVPNTAPE